MITISYRYDFNDVLVLEQSDEQIGSYSGILPRIGEQVIIKEITYRIENIVHDFYKDVVEKNTAYDERKELINRTRQYITIELTRRL